VHEAEAMHLTVTTSGTAPAAGGRPPAGTPAAFAAARAVLARNHGRGGNRR
jgi:hypothetical protein